MDSALKKEEKLLRQLRRGSEDALAQIIDQYTPYVAAIIWGMVSPVLSREDAEELISDAFLALWSAAEKVQPGKLKSYLGAIARNKAKDALRKAACVLPLEEDEIVFSSPDPERQLAEAEEREFIFAALESLGEPDRSIFIRHYYFCRSSAQIAEELDMNRITVQTRLRRGREKLREVMEKGGYEFE